MRTRAQGKVFSLSTLFASAAAAVCLSFASQGSAQLGIQAECPYRPGYLVFLDRGGNMTRGHCAGVYGTNPNWGAFRPSWANRADEFRNDGNTHNACIFDLPNYGGQRGFLRKGWVITGWYDRAESNNWNQGNGC